VGLRTCLASIVAAFTLALAPAAASASTSTFGADLDQAPAQGCSTTAGARCDYVALTPAANADTESTTAVAPQTGVVTRVQLRTDGAAATYRVRVLSGSALMVSVADERAVSVGAGARVTTLELGAGASLPILAGQRLGLAVTVPQTGMDPLFRSAARAGATCERRGPHASSFAVLGGLGFETWSSAGCAGEPLLTATVEYDQDNEIKND
jgi:hypothetical protein